MEFYSLVHFHSLRPSHETGAGQLLHHYFRGLLSVHSRYGLPARGPPESGLSIEGFDSFVTSAAAPIASGRSDPVAGRGLHPLELNTLITARL